MSKVERIISGILVIIGNVLIITGYSFDKLRILIALGVGLISGQLLNIINALKKEGK